MNTEKLFMASDSNSERGAQYGPFQTSGEAEKQAKMLNWKWVIVYTHTLEGDIVVDVETRFYHLDEDPTSIEAIRARLAPDVEVPPLSAGDAKFFESLETQMKEHYVKTRVPENRNRFLDQSHNPHRGH